MRNRGAVVIIQNERAVLIQRLKNEEEYYVFPGGGFEPGETPEEAAKREAYEELGVTVKLKKCIAAIHLGGMQYYFFADILQGQIGEGMAAEFNGASRGTYKPIWVPLKDFHSLDIRPAEMAKKISKAY
ncbi:NUDIX hydrolase [Bacillus sp. SCS-153A]|uniref:NUDIX hydrolase n=1 Tax=Rossellomorea sedimentorum TaxID=3115294 RepID=UPI003905CB81